MLFNYVLNIPVHANVHNKPNTNRTSNTKTIKKRIQSMLGVFKMRKENHNVKALFLETALVILK